MISAIDHRVLVVDADPAIHDDLRNILTRRSAAPGELEAGLLDPWRPASDPARVFDLVSAFQGREAVDRVAAAAADGRPFALAFVEMRMPPGWDGLETVERLWQ